MAEPHLRSRSRSGRILDAVLWGAAPGAASGAVLGDAIDGLGAGPGALIAAVLYVPAEAVTSIRRGPAEVTPLWCRILSSAPRDGWVRSMGSISEPRSRPGECISQRRRSCSHSRT